MWLIALFQVEMMQWIPLGHAEHRMFMVVSEMSGMSGFKLDILDICARDTVRSCPVMSGNMSGHVR